MTNPPIPQPAFGTIDPRALMISCKSFLGTKELRRLIRWTFFLCIFDITQCLQSSHPSPEVWNFWSISANSQKKKNTGTVNCPIGPSKKNVSSFNFLLIGKNLALKRMKCLIELLQLLPHLWRHQALFRGDWVGPAAICQPINPVFAEIH